MNEEENNFTLDIDAERQAMAPALNETEFEPSQLTHMVKDIPVPEMVFYTPTESFKTGDVAPQLSTMTTDLNVKVEPEDAIMKVEETEKKLATMAQGMQELAEGIQPSWLENRNKDDFEERVIVEPQNLIFEDRRDRMSMYPRWA